MKPDRLALLVLDACRDEVLAPKLGNVHPGASFVDVTYADFLASGEAISPEMGRAPQQNVGETILAAVQATRRVARSNTNLGIILLFAPICRAVGEDAPLREGVARTLESLTVEDARNAYRAIRLAMPGGLGTRDEQDVEQEPTVTLREAMGLAADRDNIARQYVTAMADIFTMQHDWFRPSLERGMARPEAIVWAHLAWMAWRPDTLIARKCGVAVAEESARRAASVMGEASGRGWNGLRDHLEFVLPQSGWLESASVRTLDQWLREDGHRRNPGTSADLVAATLLVDAILNSK